MHGLELRAVVWDANGQYELDRDRVQIDRGGQAVVVADAAVASALADVVCGLTRPVSGEILADDYELTGGPPRPNRIAMVPVGGGLLPHLSVARNIEFGLAGESSAEARAAYVTTWARRMQVEGALGLRPHRLSAEQRLRVAAARALGRRPSALVIEDRDAEVSAAAVARAAAVQNVAVLVITDASSRAAAFSSQRYTARPANTRQPAPPTAEPAEPAEPAQTREASHDAAGSAAR